MSIHSKFLIHWTGRSINSGSTPSPEPKSAQYLALLKSIVLGGFDMKEGTERIQGREDSEIAITVPRVCFSEIRLRDVPQHCGKYGHLGIGFSRQFVLVRYGCPVFYIQNGPKGVVIENLARIHQFLGQCDSANQTEYVKDLDVVLGFLKNMWGNHQQELEFYDEMEWRIVYLTHMNGPYCEPPRSGRCPVLKIEPSDIKLLVFPDDGVRKAALEDEDLHERLFRSHTPVLATVEECGNF